MSEAERRLQEKLQAAIDYGNMVEDELAHQLDDLWSRYENLTDMYLDRENTIWKLRGRGKPWFLMLMEGRNA